MTVPSSRHKQRPTGPGGLTRVRSSNDLDGARDQGRQPPAGIGGPAAGGAPPTLQGPPTSARRGTFIRCRGRTMCNAMSLKWTRSISCWPMWPKSLTCATARFASCDGGARRCFARPFISSRCSACRTDWPSRRLATDGHFSPALAERTSSMPISMLMRPRAWGSCQPGSRVYAQIANGARMQATRRAQRYEIMT
jgi:hypothetical protein